MTQFQTNVLWAVFLLSIGFLVIPIVLGVICKLIKRFILKKPSKPFHFGQKLIVISGVLIGAIWCLRYAVGYYTTVVSEIPSQELTWIEEIFNSMIHALQTFSMDEDYTQYILNGKDMMRSIAGESSFWVKFYGVYAFVLNVIAPIAGGAIIFEILTSIFPKIKLKLTYAAVWKDKYFFSELNERSLALARSIREKYQNKLLRPVFVFTDAYVDDENEESAELLLDAKLLGSICLRDDISHIPKNTFGRRFFFLIDEDEMSNHVALSDLSDQYNYKYLKKADILLFSQEDIYAQIEERILNKLKTRYGIDDEDMPIITNIQCYRNLVTDFLVKLPLYEPVIDRKKNGEPVDLNVTVLGTGYIGMEMILNTYWMGQMLDCKLNINVISKEKEEDFYKKLDSINPDIYKTTVEGDGILIKNRKGEKCDVYCTLKYHKADLKVQDIAALLENTGKNGKKLVDTDYFMVALGTDKENIHIADKIRQTVGAHHLNEDSGHKTIVAYVVYDTKLAHDMNSKSAFDYSPSDGYDVIMKAIGDLEEVYSFKNVFMPQYSAEVFKMNNFYNNTAVKEMKSELSGDRMARISKQQKRIKDEYSYRSSLARYMHLKYKVFSAGCFEKSVFDFGGNTEDPEYLEMQKAAAEDYQKKIHGKEHDVALLHRLAWLEHRRWNAFLRICGFRHTNKYLEYYDKLGTHKNLDLRLHPCLVECDELGMRAEFDENGVVIDETAFKAKSEDLDLLDDLSYELKEFLEKKKKYYYDFKYFDYPYEDIK